MFASFPIGLDTNQVRLMWIWPVLMHYHLGRMAFSSKNFAEKRAKLPVVDAAAATGVADVIVTLLRIGEAA